jgi:excisionase family DNA binding protein
VQENPRSTPLPSALFRADLLRVDEFAAALGVTRSCVRRWILERRITSVKVGRLVRIPADEVDRLVKNGLRPFRQTRLPENPLGEVEANE